MTFPEDRPAGYDEDLVWDDDNQEWVSTESINQQGGGRYRTNAVFVGGDQIYFEAIE